VAENERILRLVRRSDRTPWVDSYSLIDASSPDYRWWKPLVTLLVVAGLLVLALVAGALVFVVTASVVAYFVSGETSLTDPRAIFGFALNPDGSVLPWIKHSGGVGFAALQLPALIWAMAIVRRTGIGRYSSFVRRLRWEWLVWCLIPVAFCGVVIIAGAAAVGLFGEPLTVIGSREVPRSHVLEAVVLVWVLTPFQAAAEEYLFRGVLLQMFTGWTRRPIVAAVISSILFAASHRGVSGIVHAFIFGMLMCAITIRTGGLEASIVAHVAFNVAVQTFGLVMTGSFGFQTDSGIGFEIVSIVAFAGWAGAVLWLHSRRRLRISASDVVV
jgi:uncharacterized protein